jgi:hypothetical protein
LPTTNAPMAAIGSWQLGQRVRSAARKGIAVAKRQLHLLTAILALHRAVHYVAPRRVAHSASTPMDLQERSGESDAGPRRRARPAVCCGTLLKLANALAVAL